MTRLKNTSKKVPPKRYLFIELQKTVQRSGALFIQDHSHGAVHTRVVSEYGEFEISIAGSVESSRFVVFLHRVKKDLSGSGDTAADYYDVGIYDACNVRDCFAEHLSYRVDHGQGEFISCLRIVENVLGR